MGYTIATAFLQKFKSRLGSWHHLFHKQPDATYLLQSLHCYHQPQIKVTALRNMASRFWYLSDDLVLPSLFDPETKLATKQAMLKASKSIERDEELLPQARVDMTIRQNTG